MAFLGPESVAAAEASECAADQGKFWEFHDRLFTAQGGRDQGAFNKVALKRFATDLGLDQASFNSCVDNNLMASRVKAETEIGKEKGVNRTPTLFVNGRKMEGVPTFEDLLRSIKTARLPVPSAAR